MIRTEIFRPLSEKQKNLVIEESSVLVYPKNSIIFQEGDVSSGVYFMESGNVKRFISGVDRKECIFDVCGPGDIFGHRILFNNERQFDSSCTITESKIHFIPKELFLQFITENQEVNRAYLHLLSQDSIRHIRHSQIVSQLSLKQRTAYYLLYIQSKNLDNMNMSVEISRMDLANLLGTVKESAVRILHEFKKSNALVSTGRKMIITDIEYLKSVAKIV